MGDYTKQVKKILSENGFAFSRHGKGDHDIWYNPNTKKSISVDGEIKLRTSANEILKDAGWVRGSNAETASIFFFLVKRHAAIVGCTTVHKDSL